jgi:hypothetical protein
MDTGRERRMGFSLILVSRTVGSWKPGSLIDAGILHRLLWRDMRKKHRRSREGDPAKMKIFCNRRIVTVIL